MMTPRELDLHLAECTWVTLTPELLLHHVDVLEIPYALVRHVIADMYGPDRRAADLTGEERAGVFHRARARFRQQPR